MLIGTWGWFTDYRERYRRNGNPLYPFLTAAIEDGVVTHINWSVAEGTSEDRLRLEKFGEKLAA